MRLHDIFFWLACFFLAGVLIASITHQFSQAYLISGLIIFLAAALFLFFKKRAFVVFSLAMFLGAGYYFAIDAWRQPSDIVFNKKLTLTGIITEAEQRLNSQKLIIDSKIQITTGRYPEFEYGDKLEVSGVIKPIPEAWRGYFQKEGIVGLMTYPQIKLVAKNHGSPIKTVLFNIRKFFEASYKRVLPFEKAAFLSGLTLGTTAEFSDEFEEKLRLTGTSHLVALSGYNISIIIRYVGGLFALWWFTKKLQLPLSILVVVGFVIMTGAEPSVVRAAIMAMTLLFADHIGRIAYIPNVIVAAALVMVMINPKILAFDVGFQLSFMALIGILYLEPWLRKKFRAKKEAGFFGWRSHFWTTTSAQLAVLPILIYHFGFVSPVSIPANILLLEFIPVTMGLGFFVGFAAAINYWLAWAIALPVQIFLEYELTIINLFSRLLNML